MSSTSVKPRSRGRARRRGGEAVCMLASHVLREGSGEVDEVVTLERGRDLAEVDAWIADRLACFDAAAAAVAQPIDPHLGPNEIRRGGGGRTVKPGEADVGAVHAVGEI